MMLAIHTILRVIHIFAGVFWAAVLGMSVARYLPW
jgi:hypothetical protein